MMDLEKGHVSVARRMDAIDNPKHRINIPFGEALAGTTTDLLETIQAEMFAKATAKRDSLLTQVMVMVRARFGSGDVCIAS